MLEAPPGPPPAPAPAARPNDGSPDRSVRSTSVFTKNPTRSSSASSVRPATGVPTGISVPAPSRDSSTASAACTTMNIVTPVRARHLPPAAHASPPGPATAPRARGDWPPPGAAGRPAAPAPPAPRPARPASTPTCRRDQAARVILARPAAPAATARNPRTAPAAAPTPAPAPPAAPRTPPTDPGASGAHRPAIPRDVMHHHHQHRSPARRHRRTATPAPAPPPPGRTPAQPPRRSRPADPPGDRRLTSSSQSSSPAGPGPAGTAAPSAVREHRAQHLMPPDHIAAAPPPAPPRPAHRTAAPPPACCTARLGPSSWPRNHSRCCANDNGTRSGRGLRHQRRPRRPRRRPAAAASPASVGASNTARHRSSTPSTARTRRSAASPAASGRRGRRSHPRPRRVSRPSTSANACAQQLLRGHRPGPARPPRRGEVRRGQGRAVQLPVGGQRQRVQHHHRGRHHVLRQPRSRELPHHRGQAARTGVTSRAGRDHVGDQPLSARARHPALSCRRSPRPGRPGDGGQDGLDLAGLDPEPADLDLLIGPAQNTSSPSAVHRATSPVRYSRPPPPADQTGQPRTGPRSAPAAPHTRAPGPRPATYSSPATPGGTGPSHSSSTNTRVFAIGRADRHRAPHRLPGHQPECTHPTAVSVGPYSLTTTDPGAAPAVRAPAPPPAPHHRPPATRAGRHRRASAISAASNGQRSPAPPVTTSKPRPAPISPPAPRRRSQHCATTSRPRHQRHHHTVTVRSNASGELQHRARQQPGPNSPAAAHHVVHQPAVGHRHALGRPGGPRRVDDIRQMPRRTAASGTAASASPVPPRPPAGHPAPPRHRPAPAAHRAPPLSRPAPPPAHRRACTRPARPVAPGRRAGRRPRPATPPAAPRPSPRPAAGTTATTDSGPAPSPARYRASRLARPPARRRSHVAPARHRHRIREPRRLRLEQLRHRAGGTGHRGVVPPGQQLVPLGRLEHLDLRDPQPRISGHRRQHPHQPPGDRRDRADVKQVRRPGHRTRAAPPATPPAPAARPPPPPGRTGPSARPAAARQRSARAGPVPPAALFCTVSMTWNSGWRPRDRAGASSSTSRSNGTSWCSNAARLRLPDPGQQLPERRVPGQVGPHHQRVDEEPDQVIQRLIGPPGDRRPDRDVGAGAQLGQQHAQRGLQDHEHRHALRPRQLPQPRVHRGRDLQRYGVPAVAGHRRARPVAGSASSSGAPASASRQYATCRAIRLPGSSSRRAAPAATARSPRTAPAAAPTPAPAPPAAPRTPPTHPGASGAHDHPSPAM